ncbi:hypothetical protein [Carboxylicivirga linearis]|uniref:Uncharacterized protein n=1 Tax=Carboxylicivirga linearis TaxID=1628157 RepID=A0ABS5JSA4_9BACT|nr:hypothetical protein [Carboxylicivirga linearis]MBS2097707.1 hypothetical protein [Carboxylicivirga linearis]
MSTIEQIESPLDYLGTTSKLCGKALRIYERDKNYRIQPLRIYGKPQNCAARPYVNLFGTKTEEFGLCLKFKSNSGY